MPAQAQNALAAANATPGPAADNTTDANGEGIIVTAQFREQNLQDTQLMFCIYPVGGCGDVAGQRAR